jgi:predicted ATPase
LRVTGVLGVPSYFGASRCEKAFMRWEFVGREGELSALEAAWAAAGAEAVAPIIVVYGEPGIGKTRLMAELARVVRARRGELLWGTCYEGGDAHPYAVWPEAIRGYAERLGSATASKRWASRFKSRAAPVAEPHC